MKQVEGTQSQTIKRKACNCIDTFNNIHFAFFWHSILDYFIAFTPLKSNRKNEKLKRKRKTASAKCIQESAFQCETTIQKFYINKWDSLVYCESGNRRQILQASLYEAKLSLRMVVGCGGREHHNSGGNQSGLLNSTITSINTWSGGTQTTRLGEPKARLYQTLPV